MPIFDVTTPDGKVMEVNAPEGATERDAIAYAASIYKPPEKVKQNTGNLGDITTAFKQGVVGAGKSLTDVFGAENPVSGYLGEVQQKLGQEYSPQRTAEMQNRQKLQEEASKSGSITQEISTFLGGVAEAPVQALAQGLGSIIPYAGTGVVGGVAKLGAPTIRAINTVVGAAQGAGTIKGTLYDNVKSEMIRSGIPPEMAAEKAREAQNYLGENFLNIVGGSALGAAGARYGVENLLTPGASKSLNAKLLPRVGTAALAEAPLEGLQSGQEQYASNVGLQRQGFDVNPMEGVLGATARDAAIGALTAGVVGGVSRPSKAVPTPPPAPPPPPKNPLAQQGLLALPAPSKEATEVDTSQNPLMNPLGTFTEDQIPKDIVKRINENRKRDGNPPLKQFTIEDLYHAQQNENDNHFVQTLIAAKSGYDNANLPTDQNGNPKPLNFGQIKQVAEQRNIDTGTAGFRDFIRRATGTDNVSQLTQPQLWTALNALSQFKPSDTKVILPEGTNVSRFTEKQYQAALKMVNQEIQEHPNKERHPSSLLQIIKDSSNLENDSDAAAILDKAIKSGDLGTRAERTYNVVDENGNTQFAHESREAAQRHIDKLATKGQQAFLQESDFGYITPKNQYEHLPQTFNVKEGTFEGAPEEATDIYFGDKPTGESFKSVDEATDRAETLKALRDKTIVQNEKEIAEHQKNIERNQANLDRMVALGESNTPAYTLEQGKINRKIKELQGYIDGLNAQNEKLAEPVSIKAGKKKATTKKGYTVTSPSGQPVTFPTRAQAEKYLLDNMTAEELQSLLDSEPFKQGKVSQNLVKKVEAAFADKSAPAGIGIKTAGGTKEEATERLANLGIFTNKAAQEAQELAKILLPALKRFGLEKVGINIVDALEGGNANGAYAQSIISVALNTIHGKNTNPFGVFKHEVIHGLKDFGAFTKQEWQALENKAKSEWVQKYLKDVKLADGTSLYDAYKADGLTESEIIEEAIAEAFKHFTGKNYPAGMIGNIAYRLKQFFEALGNAFKRLGFTTAEDIFANIEAGKYKGVEAGLGETKYSKAANTKRLDMTFKQVTERIPELQEAARKVKAGTMTAAQYDKLVDKLKPVLPYDFVPEPASKEEAIAALGSKAEKEGAWNANIPEGHPVDLRLDINAYKFHGVWVNSIHNAGSDVGFPRTSYSNVSAVNNAKFIVPQDVMLDVATGEKNKTPQAVINGEWQKMSPKEAVALMNKHLNDPAWAQVGMDPDRHGYFYDRKTTEPVVSADQVIQIGPLVLVKNPVYAPKSQFKYSKSVGITPKNVMKAKFYEKELESLIKNVGTRIVGMKSNETLDDVRKAVKKLQQYTAEGLRGKDWYERSAKAVLDAFNGDEVLAEKFFQIIAITSANTEVSANFTKAVNGWTQFAEGRPIKVGTENENKKVDALLNFGEDWDGRKTNTFYTNLMEAMEGKDTGRSTIDLHMTRMIFGKDAPTDAQYELAENMVRLLGSKVGLMPRQVQAASWVTQKAKSMFDMYRQKGWKKDLSDEELKLLTFEKAVGDYSHQIKAKTQALPVTPALQEPSLSIKARTQNVTGEVIPSVQTNMAEVEQIPFALKEKLTKQIANSETIQNIAHTLGINSKIRVTVGSGAYADKVNPNLIVQMINSDPEAAQKDALDMANAMSYVFKQDATPLFRADPSLLGSDQLGFRFKFDTADLTPAQQKKILSIFKSKFGDDAGFTKMRGNELVIINYRGEDGNPFLTTDENFIDGLADIAEEISKVSKIVAQETFGAQSEYPYHDWKTEPTGKSLIEGIQSRRPERSNIQGRLDNLSESFVSNVRTIFAESGRETKFSRAISAPDTEAVRKFMNRPEGDSKIVNADGSPKIMYHGTAQDIEEFKPKQANAIFLTDNPKFAGTFADLSKSYMERDAFESATAEEQINQLQQVRKLLEEDGRDTDSVSNDIRKLQNGKKLPSDFYLDGGYSDLLDYVNRDKSGAKNLLPVYVYAKNPFDYQNSKNVEELIQNFNKDELDALMPRVSFDPTRLKKRIQEGSWSLIESKEFQSALKRAGFDGFYVSEGGNKNLAVYNSNQIKSAFNKAPTAESKDIRFSRALGALAPDTFLTSDKNPNAEGNLGFMPANSPFPKRPIRLQIGTRQDERGKGYGAKHILERALTDVSHRPEVVTKENLEDTILHIESLAKRFNRVYEDRGSFILYDSQSDDAMVVAPMNGFYGVTTMYSNPNVQRRYGNPKWSGRNIQPAVEETPKARGISVKATAEGEIVPAAVPTEFKQARAISPSQIEERAEGQPRKTGTLSIKKSLAPNAPPAGNLTALQTQENAGQRLTGTINKVISMFKDPEERIKTRIAFIDPNSGLARSLQNQAIYDSKGTLRADLLARGKAQTINLIRNGLQSGIPVVNSDGSIIIQSDETNNLANSQVLADALNDNQYIKDSGLSGRGFVAEVARALRGKEIMEEDKLHNARTGEKVNREKQVTPEQIKWAEQQLKNVPELQDIFSIWKNINTGLLNLWESVGLLSKEEANTYRNKKHYVSLAASNEDLESMMERQLGFTASGLKSTAKIHKLEGSEGLTRNIWENVDKQYASMLAAAYQNQVRKIAVDQLILADGASIPSKMRNGVAVANPDDPKVNLRYKDPTNPLADKKGVVHVIVNNSVDLAAFESFHYELTPLMKFFGGATNLLRAGALLNPMFWIRQLIRDPIHAALVANSGITTPFHSAKEFINILIKNSPEAKILAERGVIGQYDSTLDLHSFLEQVGKEKINPNRLDAMLHRAMQIHEASDAATRVAIFKKEKQAGLNKGMTEAEATNFAVMKARESINFMVHGNSKSLNALRQMIPFLSASITSLDTVYRAAIGYGLPPAEKEAAKKLFKQRAGLMLGSTIAYAMLMQDDDEYKKLPDYIKDNNWLMKNPMGEGFIKVPVPYEVGFLFKTLPEVAIRGLAGNATGKEMIKSYYDGFMHNLPTGGVPVPQAVKPALEVITNYSFFTGNPIESIGESRLPVEMRGRNASETAKFLSKSGLGLVGLSPAKIDALVQGYLAEAGSFGFTLADSLVTTVQGKETTSKNLAKQPFFKSFLTDPNSNKAVADFYQIEQTANQVAQEFSTMTKTGLGKEAVEMMQDEDKRKLMSSAPALRRIATSMTSIRKAIETTNNNQAIPPDERRDRVNKLTAQYNRVAEQGVKLANTLGVR